jgi:tetratricopeptide (TPR) repeat protein
LPYAGNRPSPSDVARQLDADAVLECTVRYAGDDVMVTAQLVDPQTGEQVWSDSYPGSLSELAGLFAMQADIATSIARVLDAELSASESRRLELQPTSSPEAYVAFLRAQDAAELSVGPENLDLALEHLNRAIELDPDFGVAYAFRGLLHLHFAIRATNFPGTPYDHDRELDLAVADADRALAIDPDIGLAHVVSGARHVVRGDFSGMEESIRRGLSLSPNQPELRFIAGNWFLSQLRPDEARAHLERLLELDPDAGSRPVNVGPLLFLAGRSDLARDLQLRQIDLDPVAAWRRQVVAFYEALLGNTGEFLRQQRIVEQLLANLPDDQFFGYAYMGVYAYGRLGRHDDARRVFETFMPRIPEDSSPPMLWVMAYLGIGDADRAYEHAKVLAAQPRMSWPGWQLWLALNPMNEPALEQPRFLELRRKLGYRSN